MTESDRLYKKLPLVKKLNVFQADVKARHPDILKLGLIQGTLSGEDASTAEQPKWLTYAHKLFHDCLAGYHISRQV